MANPSTYPSDGRITSLQNYTANLAGTELLMLVAPGNASLGVNYNITVTQMLSGVFSVLPAQNPNTVLAGPASGVASATPAFRALALADIPGGTSHFPLVGNNATSAPSYQLLTLAGGGIGTTTLPAFGVALGNTTGPLSAASPGAAGFALVSNNATSAPSFQQVSLTAGVAGVLPVVSGGIGTTGLPLDGVVLGNATALTVVPATTANLFLTSQGSASPPIFRSLVPSDFPGLVINAVASSYAATTTDINKLIALGGNPGTAAPFTLSLGTASNYTSGFSTNVYNANASRGWSIAPNGLATFILWPLQTVQIFNDSNAWKLSPQTQRWQQGASVNFFVDNINGTTTTDGLNSGGAAAFSSIQGGANTILDQVDLRGTGASLVLANGVYAETVTIAQPFSGNVVINIQGAAGQAANVVWAVGSTAAGLFVKDFGAVEINNITMRGGTGSACIQVGQDGIVDVASGMIFGNVPTGEHMLVQQGGSLNAVGGYTINGTTFGFHVVAEENSQVNFGANALTMATAATFNSFVYSAYNSVINAAGLSFTGSGAGTASTGQRFLTQFNGIIQTNGVDPNTIFPGNSNGSASLSALDFGVSLQSNVASAAGLPLITTNATNAAFQAASFSTPVTASNASPLQSGGNATTAVFISSLAGLGFYCGTGVPTIAAATSALYLRNDAVSSTTRAYINTNGGSTWVGLTATG